MRIIRKNLKVVLFLIAVLSFSMSYGQVRTITGKVTDAGSGEALPGVTIVVKGTTQGTITNFDGDYTINVQDGQSLTFSFIGYTPQEVVVGTSNQINLQLEQSVENLDEVVVIGPAAVEFLHGAAIAEEEGVVGMDLGPSAVPDGFVVIPGVDQQVPVGGEVLPEQSDELGRADGFDRVVRAAGFQAPLPVAGHGQGG